MSREAWVVRETVVWGRIVVAGPAAKGPGGNGPVSPGALAALGHVPPILRVAAGGSRPGTRIGWTGALLLALGLRQAWKTARARSTTAQTWRANLSPASTDAMDETRHRPAPPLPVAGRSVA